MKRYQEALDLLEKTFDLVQNLNYTDLVSGLKKQFEHCMVMPNQMLYVMTYNPTLVAYSRNVEKLLGKGSSLLILDDIIKNIHEEDVEYITRAVKESFSIIQQYKGDPTRLIFTAEYRIKKTDGTMIIVQRNTKSIEMDRNNLPLTTVSVVTDITSLYRGSFHTKAVLHNGATKEYFYFKTKEIEKDFALSNREVEILGLLCKGLSSKDIAEKLYISRHTVDGHRRKLLEKTNKTNTTELVSFALINQIVNQ